MRARNWKSFWFLTYFLKPHPEISFCPIKARLLRITLLDQLTKAGAIHVNVDQHLRVYRQDEKYTGIVVDSKLECENANESPTHQFIPYNFSSTVSTIMDARYVEM